MAWTDGTDGWSGDFRSTDGTISQICGTKVYRFGEPASLNGN